MGADIPSPIIAANWELSSGDQWLVPFGAGGGKLQFFGKVPINFGVQAYWNGVHPNDNVGPSSYASWTLRLQATLIL